MSESILPRRYASHIALVSSIYVPSICYEEERCGGTLMENGVGIDSMIANTGSIIEYMHGFVDSLK